MENSLKVPQKARNRITIWPSNFTPRYIPKRFVVHTNTWTQMSISILLTIAPNWDDPNVCQQILKFDTPIGWKIIWQWKRWSTDPCYNIHASWKYDAKRKKSDTKSDTWFQFCFFIWRHWVLVGPAKLTHKSNQYTESFIAEHMLLPSCGMWAQ